MAEITSFGEEKYRIRAVQHIGHQLAAIISPRYNSRMLDMQGQELSKVFAENIRSRRMQLGLTQTEVAERINAQRSKKQPQASQSAIAQLETGHRSATIQTLAEIATALELPPDLLLRCMEPADAA